MLRVGRRYMRQAIGQQFDEFFDHRAACDRLAGIVGADDVQGRSCVG